MADKTFVKISELKPEDRSKLRSYFEELYGTEYANAMIEDYESGGKKMKVAASGPETKKITIKKIKI